MKTTTTHTMTVEVEVKFTPTGCTEKETSYPKLEIEFSYTPGRPACFYDLPEGAEVDLISARLVDNPDGLLEYAPESFRKEQIKDWALDYLDSDHGYDTAVEFAEN